MLWWFRTEKKDEVLRGRTIKYLAENVLYTTPGFITNVLNGKRSCSFALANHIVNACNGKLEDYFYKK